MGGKRVCVDLSGHFTNRSGRKQRRLHTVNGNTQRCSNALTTGKSLSVASVIFARLVRHYRFSGIGSIRHRNYFGAFFVLFTNTARLAHAKWFCLRIENRAGDSHPGMSVFEKLIPLYFGIHSQRAS